MPVPPPIGPTIACHHRALSSPRPSERPPSRRPGQQSHGRPPDHAVCLSEVPSRKPDPLRATVNDACASNGQGRLSMLPWHQSIPIHPFARESHQPTHTLRKASSPPQCSANHRKHNPAPVAHLRTVRHAETPPAPGNRCTPRKHHNLVRRPLPDLTSIGLSYRQGTVCILPSQR